MACRLKPSCECDQSWHRAASSLPRGQLGVGINPHADDRLASASAQVHLPRARGASGGIHPREGGEGGGGGGQHARRRQAADRQLAVAHSNFSRPQGRRMHQLAEVLHGDVHVACGVQQEGADDNCHKAGSLSDDLRATLLLLRPMAAHAACVCASSACEDQLQLRKGHALG